MSNGVKHGGVISSFFSQYIDRLLLELKHSVIGCHIKGTYMGVLSYAYSITVSCICICC